jgi:hypothetical protein
VFASASENPECQARSRKNGLLFRPLSP